MEKALALGLKGIKQAKQLGFNDMVFRYYLYLSSIVRQKDLAKAIQYAEEGLKYASKKSKAAALATIAQIHYSKQNYACASKYFEMSKVISLQNNDQYGLVTSYEGLMRSFAYTKQEKKVITYY